MLENIFTNVFGRSKNKSSTNRNSTANDPSNFPQDGGSSAPQMTGPFSMSAPQMPQPPNMPYPMAAPYPPSITSPTHPSTAPQQPPYYPSLPFSQMPSVPGASGSHRQHEHDYPTGTLSNNSQVSPLDQVPFEAKLTLTNSTNLVSLDHLFKEIKKAADVVDRADAYLRSSQSDYDFKVEQGLIYQ